tara:strand:+ start:100 stop:357 length:258 start_codon:yes stop_codon:yes gene_type:complete
MTRTTLKAVNAQLPKGVELVKGEGYLFFHGDEPNIKTDKDIFVYSLNDINIDGIYEVWCSWIHTISTPQASGWLGTIKAMRKESA